MCRHASLSSNEDFPNFALVNKRFIYGKVNDIFFCGEKKQKGEVRWTPRRRSVPSLGSLTHEKDDVEFRSYLSSESAVTTRQPRRLLKEHSGGDYTFLLPCIMEILCCPCLYKRCWCMFERGHQPASPHVNNEKVNHNISTSIPFLSGDHAFIDICVISWEDCELKMPKKETHMLSFLQFWHQKYFLCFVKLLHTMQPWNKW